mmetsp:Transcript_12203/g.22883  ORF Transcript_12203/g.22883 Transcript_12203/m.22883 type:complete len:550 (+) Transcript_12203:45-1694(+)
MNESIMMSGDACNPNNINNTTTTINTNNDFSTTNHPYDDDDDHHPNHHNIISSTKTSTSNITPTSIVSSRGYRALKPPLPYLSAFFQALSNPCHEIHNSQGYIALCVAENKLILDTLSRRLLQQSSQQSSQSYYYCHAAFESQDNYCYNDMRGMMHARESVARFLTRKFLQPCTNSTTTSTTISGEHVILGSGCAGLLNGLFFSLLEEGDAVLIPAPYYAAFESDMKVMAQCIPVPVYMANPSKGPTVEELEFARVSYKSSVKVKMLLLTNPNNPLGTVYSAQTVKNAIDWARCHDMHTVVDEIYALSIHDTSDDTNHDTNDNSNNDTTDNNNDNNTFQSVIYILDNQLGHNVHFLWALSKDFGSSGFRVGVLYTQNQVLNNALSNLNVFSSVSQPMQSVIAELLQDDEFIDSFLNHSRKLLRASYEIVVEALEEMKIPYVPAQAGMFVYCDFSSWLPTNTFEGEAMLVTFFQDQVRIIMTPGECQRDDRPGMFRICYAWVTPNVLRIAMERLKHVALDRMRVGGIGGDGEGNTDHVNLQQDVMNKCYF